MLNGQRLPRRLKRSALATAAERFEHCGLQKRLQDQHEQRMREVAAAEADKRRIETEKQRADEARVLAERIAATEAAEKV